MHIQRVYTTYPNESYLRNYLRNNKKWAKQRLRISIFKLEEQEVHDFGKQKLPNESVHNGTIHTKCILQFRCTVVYTARMTPNRKWDHQIPSGQILPGCCGKTHNSSPRQSPQNIGWKYKQTENLWAAE